MQRESIEDVQLCTTGEAQIGSQTPPWLAPPPGEVIVLAFADRKPAQRCIAIVRSAQVARASEDQPVAPAESLANLLCLIAAPDRGSVDHLLQGDAVGVERRQHARDALGRDAPIPPAAFMDVVSDQANRARQYCCRWKNQPTLSNTRSHTGRFFHSSNVTRRPWVMSLRKSSVSRVARPESRAARLTSSLIPNERLSKLVDPTTAQRPSTIMILA